ncbi:B box and SPRY domain-containing protein isoform X2 [Pyxicephalus adspersus]|uniref:B box and SPRY domain-containing protein isoform X2 n=1 Tax=Pyxicephalus adspersus TaxID=30357 RepID=UPI003B5A0B81
MGMVAWLRLAYIMQSMGEAQEEVRTCHQPQTNLSSANFQATSACVTGCRAPPRGSLLPGNRCREQTGRNHIHIFLQQPTEMSHLDSVPTESPVWVITGSQSWTGTGQMDILQTAEKDIKFPFAVEWIPDEQMATLSLEPSGVEKTTDFIENPFEEQPSPTKLQVQEGTSPCAQSSIPGTCNDHGHHLSLFCYQDHKLICHQCKSHGTCQSHKTNSVEERATQLRNKIVDQCEKLQLQTAGIEKYLTDALPAKIPHVASTARASSEMIIQRLTFIRNVCDNEEQRLLEEVHTEEERVQQGISTQQAHWIESSKKLSGIRNYLVDMLTKMDDISLINSESEMDERTEEAEGILEPEESNKLNFNINCVQSPLLNRLWASTVLCLTTACEEVTFDEKSMSPLLAFAEDNSLKFLQKKAKIYQDGPERFDHWPNCLANESFPKGIHCWKVNVEKSCAYKLGITYRSIARKGASNDARLGFNPVSWIFSRYDKDFRFSHNSHHEVVELLKSPKHIGVLVDIDGGELVFFDPGSCVILHSHKTKFTAPISPVFAVADESISLEK